MPTDTSSLPGRNTVVNVAGKVWREVWGTLMVIGLLVLLLLAYVAWGLLCVLFEYAGGLLFDWLCGLGWWWWLILGGVVLLGILGCVVVSLFPDKKPPTPPAVAPLPGTWKRKWASPTEDK